MTAHLTMDQLVALRDDDRSEPGHADARRHIVACSRCQVELDRLHQRTARLRALPILAPSTDEFPAVRERVTVARRQHRWRRAAQVGLAAAAAFVLALIGNDIVHPRQLGAVDAHARLAGEITKSQQLEQKLQALDPDQRVMDGRTVLLVIKLEDQIANLDAQIADTAGMLHADRLEREIKLWQERVGLMNALVDVHMTKASNVGL